MNYQATGELGQGRFGIVERVLGSDGQEYARKRLNTAAFARHELPTIRKRFEREVRYQEKIVHPNVANIIEYALDSDPPWFIMPLAVPASPRISKRTEH